MSIAQKYGYLGGAASILIMLAIYFYSEAFLDRQLMVHHRVNMGKYLIFAGFMFATLNAFLKAEPGVKPFKELIRPGFICFLIANLIYHVFYFIMLKWVDTDLLIASNEYMTEYMNNLNATRQPGKIEDLSAGSQSIALSSSFFAYVKEIILGFIIAAILAFFRRNG